MGVDPSSSGRRRRQLAPSEKYELYLQVLTGQATAAARAEIERLRATVTEQAVVIHLAEGKARWD